VANTVPGQYRGVAVARAGPALDAGSLRDYFVGREAYRRTRFIVVRDGEATAVVRVVKASEDPLFAPITGLEVLAGPDECVFVHEPDADTAVPSALAEVARRRAPGARAVVVRGRYEHVSFIVEPRPVRIRVREVVPPAPAKLFDQASRVLATAEDLPPIELVPELVDLSDLAATHRSENYLLPCRGSGVAVAGAGTVYLDERPERQPWTLLGCTRSRQIHRWFYGDDPPAVDVCPLRTAVLHDGTDSALLTKCCMREEDIEQGDGWVSVPWGSSLDQVRQALAVLARQREPAWERV
jgi:hypothetical protein